MRRLFVGSLIALAWAAAPALGQVEAKTATPAEVRAVESGPNPTEQAMDSPMLLELPMKSASGISAAHWMEKTKVPIWSSSETRKFVCDRAHVERVMFKHGKPKKDFVPITLTAFVQSKWFRQDIDVTLSLLGLDGQQVAKKIWDDETFGNDSGTTFGGRSKYLELEAKVPRVEWDRWIANEGAPTIQVLLDIQGNSSDD